ncbi:PIN domain-containing protein [candidate division KSB1 bacterium]|nr:PIN domain-containing protein [candidate division KSB1 bacterium]
MNKILFIDTSYLLALVNTQDEYHERAQNLAEQTSERLITTEAILTEFANSLTKPQWRQLAVETINDLREDPDVKIISVSSDLFSKGLKLYSERLDKEWSLTDCISFEVMKERKLSNALTTDHHFEQAGFRVLLR